MIIPAGATVFRIYEQPDGSKEIEFENGNPRDYIWSNWSKSNWKSIDWLLGKVSDDQYGIIEDAKNMKWKTIKTDKFGRVFYAEDMPPTNKEMLFLSAYDCIVVGYARYAAGDRASLTIITPGHSGMLLAWCDCLPDKFVWINSMTC